MQDLRMLDVTIEATAAARDIMRRLSGITGDQARAMVRVEITRDGLYRIMEAASMSSEVFHDRPSPMREVATRGYGTFSVLGIAYYLVPSLPDGAEWRVINPLNAK